MPHGIVALVDQISYCLCGTSLYHSEEQLHLAEFAALEADAIQSAIDIYQHVRAFQRGEQRRPIPRR